MRHTGSAASSKDRRKVRNLRQEKLESRSAPFLPPMHVPPEPEPPPPDLPPENGQRREGGNPSPPCYGRPVNSRVLRHI